METGSGQNTPILLRARRFEESEIDLPGILEQELQAAVFEFPFNSVARAYRLGEPEGPEAADLPEKFGGDCLEQVQRLQKKLSKRGITSEIILSPNDMHLAVTVPDGEGFQYLDPSVNVIEAIDSANMTREARTYPHLNGEWSTLSGKMKDGILTATWTMAGGPQKIRRFNPGTEDPNTHADLDIQRAFFGALKDLYWNTIDPETGALLKLRVPKKEGATLGVHTNGSNGYKFEGKSEEFDPTFERIVECSGESEAKVRALIEEARKRWRAFSTQL